MGERESRAAHDLNNLLTIIIADLELLVAESGSGAIVGESAGEALEAALRRADLTRRLLGSSRRKSLVRQESDLNAIVHGLHGMLARGLVKAITLELMLADDLHPVALDRAELESAIINIVSNAMDAMPTGGCGSKPATPRRRMASSESV